MDYFSILFHRKNGADVPIDGKYYEALFGRIKPIDAAIYGYRVSKTNSDPDTRVEYLYDAVGMTPAHMNYQTGQFDYGSWSNAWFVAGNKPVALKYDGSVDYELDPDDYTKKKDGTASDILNSAYAGNFMASMPTVWIKRYEDENYRYVLISDKKVASDFYADAHDNGTAVSDTIYLPMFKGVMVDTKIKSFAGAFPTGGTTSTEEVAATEANGTGWQMWDWAKHELISDLLTLISKNTNSQAVFGKGVVDVLDDADTYHGMYKTGYNKSEGEWVAYSGQFSGSSDSTHHVRVFHIEDFWGNRNDRCLGLNAVNSKYVYKMVRPYSTDSDSTYTATDITIPANGYQKDQNVGRFGNLPKETGATATTYDCDNFWGTSGTRLALIGGHCGYKNYAGDRCLRLDNTPATTYWGISGSPVYNPASTAP